MIDTARGQLEAVLDTDDPAEKDFHVRQALQLLVAVDETETTEGADR